MGSPRRSTSTGDGNSLRQPPTRTLGPQLPDSPCRALPCGIPRPDIRARCSEIDDLQAAITGQSGHSALRYTALINSVVKACSRDVAHTRLAIGRPGLRLQAPQPFGRPLTLIRAAGNFASPPGVFRQGAEILLGREAAQGPYEPDPVHTGVGTVRVLWWPASVTRWQHSFPLPVRAGSPMLYKARSLT